LVLGDNITDEIRARVAQQLPADHPVFTTGLTKEEIIRLIFEELEYWSAGDNFPVAVGALSNITGKILLAMPPPKEYEDERCEHGRMYPDECDQCPDVKHLTREISLLTTADAVRLEDVDAIGNHNFIVLLSRRFGNFTWPYAIKHGGRTFEFKRQLPLTDSTRDALAIGGKALYTFKRKLSV
jgi:hypothetical protein